MTGCDTKGDGMTCADVVFSHNTRRRRIVVHAVAFGTLVTQC
jgi:hypothetical protein